jgi:hypothetical protein
MCTKKNAHLVVMQHDGCGGQEQQIVPDLPANAP